jgi:hypothetical protein
MKKEMFIIFILGIALIVFSMIFNKNDKDSSEDSEELVSSLEETDDYEDDDYSEFNSKDAPDDFAYVEYLRNFLNAENSAIESKESAFLNDFMEDGSDFETAEKERIIELRKDNKINSIEFIELEEVIKSDEEDVLKFYSIVTLNGDKKRFYIELLNKDERYYMKKMKILNLEGKTEVELG